MIQEIIEKINEAKTAVYVLKTSATYDEKLDFLDANGGYESFSELMKGQLGIKGNWNSKDGDSWDLSSSEFKKASELFGPIGKLELLDGVVDFGKVGSKKDFDKLSSKGKIAFIYNWLTGNTDIQPSNIEDLVVSATNRKAVFTSNKATVDVGKDTISGVDELPFNMPLSELKKIVKEVF